jgi:hypothetical protein
MISSLSISSLSMAARATVSFSSAEWFPHFGFIFCFSLSSTYETESNVLFFRKALDMWGARVQSSLFDQELD